MNGADAEPARNFGTGLPRRPRQVDARPFVDPAIAAKYVTPQGTASETYYYTNRDAFRTEGSAERTSPRRYNHGVGAGIAKIDLFIQAHVVNIFNQFQISAAAALRCSPTAATSVIRVPAKSENQSLESRF